MSTVTYTADSSRHPMTPAEAYWLAVNPLPQIRGPWLADQTGGVDVEQRGEWEDNE